MATSVKDLMAAANAAVPTVSADPASPYYDPAFQKDRPIIVYCASGGRACLAGKTLADLGYTKVHTLGGFKAATDAGMGVEPG